MARTWHSLLELREAVGRLTSRVILILHTVKRRVTPSSCISIFLVRFWIRSSASCARSSSPLASTTRAIMSVKCLGFGLASSACTPPTLERDPQPAQAGYTNPVISSNHPDPGIIEAEGAYYLYSTAGASGTMPVLRSTDLISWEPHGDGMPKIALWTAPGFHWAPDVIAVGGRYHAYYTARRANANQQAIGVAVADVPAGPFVDDSTTPLLMQPNEGGCIDASPFRDGDGRLWLLWKNDGNRVNLPSYIYLQQLSDDGLELTGSPRRIIARDQAWEIYTIEGPAVVERNGSYYLFYSAGEYWNESYGVGYAVASSIEGPWTKPETTPILSANDVAAGPGHGMPIKVGDDWWYVYHAWEPDLNTDTGRLVWLSPLRFTENGPRIDGPLVDNPERPSST